jgi:hypothetical protein
MGVCISRLRRKMAAFTVPILSPNCCWGRKIEIKSQPSFLTSYPPSSGKVFHQETRERRTLLTVTVETEANGDSKSTYARGPSFVGSLGSSCRYKKFLSCLVRSSPPCTKYFFPHRTLFHFFCPHNELTRGATELVQHFRFTFAEEWCLT